MVFASFSFLFVFLPIALVGYYLVAKLGAGYAVGWLVLASLAFYARLESRVCDSAPLLHCVQFLDRTGAARTPEGRQQKIPKSSSLFRCGCEHCCAFFLQVLGANAFVGAFDFTGSLPILTFNIVLLVGHFVLYFHANRIPG